VFDFSGISDTSKYSCRQVGVRVEASWLHLKGLELKGTLQLNMLNHESWCVYVIGGGNDVFEQLDAHHNTGPGFFVQQGGNNTFLNCDSHENEDRLTSNGDGQSADGFGCHPNRTTDTGNVFRGCLAWWNSDDGWDFINADAACTVEYSWAWYNGYKPDAVTGGQPVSLAAGNGNGFKGGGYGDPQADVPAAPPLHTIRFDCAFYNKANGLYANHENVSPYFYDNTSFNNGTDVDMLGLNGTTVTSVGTLRNNLAYSNNGHGLLADMTNGGPISDAFDSWDANLNLQVTNADFQSVTFVPPASCPEAYAAGGTRCCAPTDATCFAGMAGARADDGRFSGAAPYLGCFETGLAYDPSDGGTSTDAGGTGNTGEVSSEGGIGNDASSAGASGGGASSGTSGPTEGDGATSAPGSTNGAGVGDGTAASGSSGCGCRVARPAGRDGIESLVALGGFLVLFRRRRRRRATECRGTRSTPRCASLRRSCKSPDRRNRHRRCTRRKRCDRNSRGRSCLRRDKKSPSSRFRGAVR
jgi:MYXO-CTERM domain-containing protein